MIYTYVIGAECRQQPMRFFKNITTKPPQVYFVVVEMVYWLVGNNNNEFFFPVNFLDLEASFLISPFFETPCI